jgi:hypothetical protein
MTTTKDKFDLKNKSPMDYFYYDQVFIVHVDERKKLISAFRQANLQSLHSRPIEII